MLSTPGLRVFGDARFRVLVAGLLLAVAVVGSGAFLARRAEMPLAEGQFGIDFADYFSAADRLRATGSPYAPEMLEGPVAAQGTDRYRYPPPLAQVLAPTTPLGLPTATLAWFVVQVACVIAGVLVAARAGGIRLGAEAILWLGAATAWFLPVLDTLWKGNVSGVQVLLVALLFAGAAAGGLAAAVNVALKLVPILVAPIVLLRGRRSAAGLGIGLAAIVLPSMILAPTAWQDYVVVLGNLLSGSADYAANLAPDALLRNAIELGDGLAQLVRWLSVGLGLAMLVAGVVLARRSGGWPAAVILGTSGLLLLPAALWYHYFAMLLPLAIVTWRVATTRTRAAIVLGGAGVTIGLAWLPLALLGAGVMVGAALRAVWPAGPGSDA